MSGTAALPELREAQAPPEIAAIYDALRRATGVPLVNLIWRHLATLPGVLPWAWAAVRPPLDSGAVAAARARLAAAQRLPAGIAAVDAQAWRAAGLAPEMREPALAVVESYNRGNLTNLILLTALRRRLAGVPPGPAKAAGATPAAIPPELAPLAPVPPFPVLAELPGETQAKVRALAARHAGAADGGVVPSLYIHLAHWPALLAALPHWLAPLLAPPGVLEAARDAAIAAATQEAEALQPLLALGEGVPGGQEPVVLAALTRFTTQVIPDMVPVGLALRRVLDA